MIQFTESAHSPGRRLRALLEAGTVVMPGAFNAISARLVEAAGFDAVYISGAGVTNALTAMPDIALLTLTEMAQQCRYICNAVSLPCIADADTGYGETLNLARTVQEMEAAGLAGIHLEDQVSPKRCGHLDGKQVIPPKEMAGKIAAAARARRDSEFFLIARTDARGVNGFDDAIERAKLYLDAGADGIFPEALQNKEEFAEFARKVPAPLLANMTEFGKSPLLSVEELAGLGYKMIIFPMTQLRVMMKAAQSVLAEIKSTGSQASVLDRMQTRAELYELLKYNDYTAFDREIAERFGSE
jgi:methylisocitrate lyase